MNEKSLVILRIVQIEAFQNEFLLNKTLGDMEKFPMEELIDLREKYLEFNKWLDSWKEKNNEYLK